MVTDSEKQKVLDLAIMVGLHDICETQIENQILSDEDILWFIITLLETRYCIPREVIPKSSQFFESVLFGENFSDSRFRQHLRMNRYSFFQLLNEIKGDPVFYGSQNDIALQLAIGLTELGLYGNGGSLRIIAAKFGSSEGSVNNYTNRVITAITNLSQKWIKWPCAAERKMIGIQMAGELFPKCIGFLDGSDAGFYHAPTKEKETYWSRKKKYCMQFQIVCDPNKIIRHFTTGFPGSVHDSKVFTSCPLYRNISLFFSKDEYILADSAYAKTEHVVVPYKRVSKNLLDKKKMLFNRHLSSKRVYVEHTIGILKGRFQSLQSLRINVNLEKGHQKACRWIHACVILHNFLMAVDPWTQDEDVIYDEEDDDIVENDAPPPNERAELKRSALSTIVNSML